MGEMLAGMMTEEEVLKVMGIKPSELGNLRREKGLPFVKLSARRRVYLEADLMGWFQGHRMVLDRDAGTNQGNADNALPQPAKRTNKQR